MWVHANCDCTIRRVTDDTETSDPDILGSDLELLMQDRQFNFLYDGHYRSYNWVMWDAIKKFSTPGGSARTAAQALRSTFDIKKVGWLNTLWGLFTWGKNWQKITAPKLQTHKRNSYHGIYGDIYPVPATYSRPEVLKVVASSRTYDKYFTTSYQGLSGVGAVQSLPIRPEPLKAKLPKYTYQDRFNWAR